MWMDDILVKCEKLDHFGRGIGYVNDKIIFVPDLLPDEEALVKIVLNKKKYMVGQVIKRMRDSAERILPKCQYENCGCALKNLSYEKTLEYKLDKVREILQKYSGLEVPLETIVPSEVIYGYRDKITLKVHDGKIGYYRNGTHDLLEIDKCVLVSSKMNEIISTLKKMDLSKVHEVVIKDFGEVMIWIKGDLKIDELKKYADSIYINNDLVYGKEYVRAQLGDFAFYVSKDSFFQVNMNVALKLYNKVLESIKGDFEQTVLDLYCGTGTISIFLSKHFKRVIGVEINEEAIRCANLNKELNGADNVDFILADASEIEDVRADIVVLDPPRSGMSEKTIKDVLNIGAKKIVYVSCDPMTLARDLKKLKDEYDLKEVTLFDMYGWTYHVETLCLLERR